MKLRTVTKLGKEKQNKFKKIYYDLISAKFDVIVSFAIYGQFGETLKADS